MTGYARHVDNLIWCKSIVKDLNTKSITREAQAHNREVMCESSVYQTDELMNKNVIEGADSGRAGPGSRSPSGQTGSVNDAVVSGKGINLSGEASMSGSPELQPAQEPASRFANTCRGWLDGLLWPERDVRSLPTSFDQQPNNP